VTWYTVPPRPPLAVRPKPYAPGNATTGPCGPESACASGTDASSPAPDPELPELDPLVRDPEPLEELAPALPALDPPAPLVCALADAVAFDDVVLEKAPPIEDEPEEPGAPAFEGPAPPPQAAKPASPTAGPRTRKKDGAQCGRMDHPRGTRAIRAVTSGGPNRSNNDQAYLPGQVMNHRPLAQTSTKISSTAHSKGTRKKSEPVCAFV
jgi:hypothetical protein